MRATHKGALLCGSAPLSAEAGGLLLRAHDDVHPSSLHWRTSRSTGVSDATSDQ